MNELKTLEKKIRELENTIEEQKQEIHLLTETSLTDVLTGMRNRRAHNFRIKEIEKKINRLKFEKKDTDGYFYYIILDLNNFKLVNDTYGHDAGDEVLKQVAGIIQKSIRPTDYAFRLGGDEFAIILKDTRREDVKAFLYRLISENDDLYYKNIKIGASLGVAKYKGSDVEETLKKADKSMYKSKHSDESIFTCAEKI